MCGAVSVQPGPISDTKTVSLITKEQFDQITPSPSVAEQQQVPPPPPVPQATGEEALSASCTLGGGWHAA